LGERQPNCLEPFDCHPAENQRWKQLKPKLCRGTRNLYLSDRTVDIHQNLEVNPTLHSTAKTSEKKPIPGEQHYPLGSHYDPAALLVEFASSLIFAWATLQTSLNSSSAFFKQNNILVYTRLFPPSNEL
jgi:hypothetical protein